MRLRNRILTVGVAVAATALAAPAAPAVQAAPPGDTTTTAEKKRVDGVPTPELDWYECYGGGQCAIVRLPLDYDAPKGATTEIAVTRLKARKPEQRIGSLFVNPGGPGGQGTLMALQAPSFLSADVLDRFDIVGFDPRGIGFSDHVTCFKSHREQTIALAGMNVAFPFGSKEEAAYIKSAKALGEGCATTGGELAGAMSTAQVARDMDVLRRAVGDEKLTYLGDSYGSAIGQYYAAMFPDRLRSAALDGIINPVSWVGTKKTRDRILDDRMRSADGAYKALREILVRCGKAGKAKCAFAEYGDPVKNFDILAERLKAKPADINGKKVTYADFVADMRFYLYYPEGYTIIDRDVTDLWEATSPGSTRAQAAEARKALAGRIAERRAEVQRQRDAVEKATAKGFPYNNTLDAFSGVVCTDARHPKKAGNWPVQTAEADERAPYFGRPWGWGTVQCAGESWKVRDEDAYTGPFDRRTSAPVLFVGNYYDPATNYDAAVSSSELLPNSRLLSSDSWGHTAYGTSACVTSAVDDYLLTGKLPPVGKVCVGDIQPFADAPESARTTRAPADASAMTTRPGAAGRATELPPVATPVPKSVLLGTR